MGYHQTTELFYGQEIKGTSWTEFEHIEYGNVSYKNTGGDESKSETNRHWLVAHSSSITLSSGKYETNNAVKINELLLNTIDVIAEWDKWLTDGIAKYGLEPIGTPTWVAAASGS